MERTFNNYPQFRFTIDRESNSKILHFFETERNIVCERYLGNYEKIASFHKFLVSLKIPCFLGHYGHCEDEQYFAIFLDDDTSFEDANKYNKLLFNNDNDIILSNLYRNGTIEKNCSTSNIENFDLILKESYNNNYLLLKIVNKALKIIAKSNKI